MALCFFVNFVILDVDFVKRVDLFAYLNENFIDNKNKWRYDMKLKKLSQKLNNLMFMHLINALALTLAIDSVNAACVWIMHQPKVPEEMKEYMK